jgi:hypothetical protein
MRGKNQMKVISDITGYGLTEDKEYEVIYEYDTVYEIKLDNGNTCCRPKGFFKKIEGE